MFRVFVLVLAVVALFLAGFAVWTNFKDDFSSSDHTHPPTAPLSCTDGAFDKDLSCWNEDTVFAVRDSIRPIFLRYADEEQKTVGTRVVPGIIASDKYVVTGRNVIPPDGSGVHIADAYLLAIPSDRGAPSEHLGAPTAADEALGFVAFPRPADDKGLPAPTLLAVSITLGASSEASTTDQIVIPMMDVFPQKDGSLPAQVTVFPAGNVRDRAQGNTPAFMVNAMPVGTPLFALRDGTPEFVGFVFSTSSTFSVAITAELVAKYFQHLAIPTPFDDQP